jgi:hypothetical protein
MSKTNLTNKVRITTGFPTLKEIALSYGMTMESVKKIVDFAVKVNKGKKSKFKRTANL